MKSQLFKVTLGPNCSFSMCQIIFPHVQNRWHYHQETELIYFKKGTGIQFIGDNVRTFNSGDILLLGPRVPHCWRFDKKFIEGYPRIKPDVVVVHFNANFWGNHFLELPENSGIKTVLEKAKRGVKITGKARKDTASLIEEMSNAKGPFKILLLLKALHSISSSNDLELLSSVGFQPNHKEIESDRLNAVYQYSLANFKKKIRMEDIANVINMSSTSFCRYFKSKTKKTYSSFLLDIRIGAACTLLIENKLSIKQICYESGFHNSGSFHKYFKMVTKMTPLEYQRISINRNNI